ncbi:hypothetical protein EJ110_NYTH57683 [Nymphaea thermarum]|nr:hypothetical protein EJ110_NYTH57683 [Nymphaea thermarum]
MGYIDGTIHCPPKTVGNSDDVNPDYILWLKHDQLVLSWIITSLSENVLSQVIGLETAYEGLNGDPMYTSDVGRASWFTLDSRTQYNRKYWC